MLDAIHNGRARGNGAMARDLVVGQDAEDVAAFVARAVGKYHEVAPPAAGALRQRASPRCYPAQLTAEFPEGKRGTHICWGESTACRVAA